MANFASHPERRGALLPDVPRPTGRIWHSLTAESIRWEGQVLIVGDESDLPALLVITRERVALIANGEITLEIPRIWLRPAPQLAAENGIRLFVSPEGADEPSPLLLRARQGRGAAAEVVAVLTGRSLPLAPPSSALHIPNWKERIGAAAPVALPPIEEDETPESAPRPTWPPVEQEAVALRAHPATPSRRGQLPAPGPVPVDISRAARARGTEEDGFTIADGGDRDLGGPQPMPETPGRGRQFVTWTLRAAILLVLVGTIGYFGRDRLEAGFADARDLLPDNVQRTLGVARTGSPDEVAFTSAPETVDDVGDDSGDGTNGAKPPQESAPEPTETPVETEVAQSVPTEEDEEPGDSTANIGGATGKLPPTMNADDLKDPTRPLANEEETDEVPAEEPTAEPTEEPTAEPTVEPTEEPTVEPTAEPTAEPTEEPTVEPTVEPTAEPTEEPTEEPTVEPTAEPTEEPTEEPTVEPTQEPTEEPTEEATVEPTEEPATEPTEESTPEPTIEPTVEPTEEATVEPTSEPTLEPQAPSVDPESTPQQAVVANGFRYTVEGASIGETVPELPQINSVGGYGEWVLLNVYGENMSIDPQVFDMSTFRLYADGQELLVDVGNAWVNGLLGNAPAYGNTDAVQWAPGESHRFTLTFLAPPDAQSLILEAGDQTIDLSPAIQEPEPLTSEITPVASDLIEAQVVDVVDGETIVVEIDGVRQTVRYLSVSAPRGDACYAAESTKANRALVEGATVTLERQSTNVDARGNWVRDVWVTNNAGQPVLVSQQLVLDGAAEVKISDPNTRFAGWLESSEANARDTGAGLWASCGE